MESLIIQDSKENERLRALSAIPLQKCNKKYFKREIFIFLDAWSLGMVAFTLAEGDNETKAYIHFKIEDSAKLLQISMLSCDARARIKVILQSGREWEH